MEVDTPVGQPPRFKAGDRAFYVAYVPVIANHVYEVEEVHDNMIKFRGGVVVPDTNYVTTDEAIKIYRAQAEWALQKAGVLCDFLTRPQPKTGNTENE